jgi:MoaA/NifB/PqqE/SkfB family radical SAM enzyme
VRAARVRFAGARHPLAARIQVTRRCALRCSYCKLPDEDGDPLTGREILSVLDQLRALGCLRVSFSGGEPMLRDDIGWLVDACDALGMAPEMNSSGHGFASRVRRVRRLRLLKLSLDGPEEVHDRVRGRRGSYAEVRAALEAARDASIRTVLVATITRHNVDRLDHVLELARDEGVMAAFQPIKPYYKGAVEVEDLLPRPRDMARAVRRLERARSDGFGDTLRNSSAGLAHLARWPRYGPLRCWAGRIFCIVGADGTLYPCDRTRIVDPLPNCLELGMEEALARLPDPDCEGCGFCGALELNFAMALDPGIATTIHRLVSDGAEGRG